MKAARNRQRLEPLSSCDCSVDPEPGSGDCAVAADPVSPLGSGDTEIVAEIAAPASNTNTNMQRSPSEINEMRIGSQARGQQDGIRQRRWFGKRCFANTGDGLLEAPFAFPLDPKRRWRLCQGFASPRRSGAPLTQSPPPPTTLLIRKRREELAHGTQIRS